MTIDEKTIIEDLRYALVCCVGFITGEDSTTDADKDEVLGLAKDALAFDESILTVTFPVSTNIGTRITTNRDLINKELFSDCSVLEVDPEAVYIPKGSAGTIIATPWNGSVLVRFDNLEPASSIFVPQSVLTSRIPA